MKKRKVIDSLKEESESKVVLQVITKMPNKWLLTDLETGQVYIGTNNKEIGKQWQKIQKA